MKPLPSRSICEKTSETKAGKVLPRSARFAIMTLVDKCRNLRRDHRGGLSGTGDTARAMQRNHARTHLWTRHRCVASR